MWENSKFEERMRLALESELGESTGQTVFGQYTGARGILLEDVLEEIRGAEPYLTDHGPDHIRNVLDNVERLLGNESRHFNATELYILGLSVLFHDVGNLDGREGHNQRIAKYYDRARPGDAQRNAPEKRLVIAAAKAHTGKTDDGGRDTLGDVPDTEYLNGIPIKLRDIATVVRFADELAEGPQRTSLFLQSRGAYPPESAIHHRYAAVTQVAIDRQLRRISLCYTVVLQHPNHQEGDCLDELRKLLEYICRRVAKLDDERKYARFYCPDLLVPFHKIQVQIEITDGQAVEVSVGPVDFSDKVVPDGKSDALQSISEELQPEQIVRQVETKMAYSAAEGASTLSEAC